MPKFQEIDFSRLDYAALDNDQRARVLRLAMERGRIERSASVWRMMDALATGFRKVAAATAAWHSGFRRRRRRQSEAATLSALSDRTLRDIGLYRCEIDRVVMTGRRAA